MSGTGTELSMQKKTKRNKRLASRLTMLGIFFALFLISGIISYSYVVNADLEKKEVPQVDPLTGIKIDIPLGSSTASIANMLNEQGIINFPFVFKMLSKVNGYDGTYKSGTHYVTKELDYEQLMLVLTSNPVSKTVTFPEGFSFKQISDRLFKENLIDRTKFNKVANEEKFDYKFLNSLPQREHRLEGYLFPDTYDFDVSAGEKTIIKRMLDRFDEIFIPEYYEKAKKLNMTPDQIIIMASLIEREAKEWDERRTIAGVFYNRLKSKNSSLKKLQSCATIQYILLNRDGKVKEKLTDEDTKIDDPYNTYKIEGLPPGPICCPGKDSIEAALEPEDTDYYYFVAKGDGTHQFSKTLQEHLAAVKKYGLS